MRALHFTLIALGALLAGCDAYSEDYGPTPFLCGDTEPRCPDGYTCQDDITTGQQVCVGGGGSIDSEFDCADDSSIEPNNMLDVATATDAMYSRDGLAICPAGDKDVFAVNVTGTQSTVELVVEFQTDGGPLVGAILNAGGVPVKTAEEVPGEPFKIRATSQNLPGGMYYAQVAGSVTASLPLNNYKVSITIR